MIARMVGLSGSCCAKENRTHTATRTQPQESGYSPLELLSMYLVKVEDAFLALPTEVYSPYVKTERLESWDETMIRGLSASPSCLGARFPRVILALGERACESLGVLLAPTENQGRLAVRVSESGSRTGEQKWSIQRTGSCWPAPVPFPHLENRKKMTLYSRGPRGAFACF